MNDRIHESNAQHFTATITKSGNKAMIVLPFDPNQVWATKEQHHITGSVNGYTVRGPLGFDGTQYYVSLGVAWRRDNGLDGATSVEVVLAPEGPQSSTMASDIVVALDAEPQARTYFEGLATFYRKNYVRWIEGAKRPATRSARIAEMIRLLKDGQKER